MAMTRFERAAQLWSVLTLAARNQQIISYEIAGRLVGVPRQAVGNFLGPVQDYCIQNNLPPITALIISEVTGLPSEGFIAADDVLPAQNRVFVYVWLSLATPTPEDFELAFSKGEH